MTQLGLNEVYFYGDQWTVTPQSNLGTPHTTVTALYSFNAFEHFFYIPNGFTSVIASHGAGIPQSSQRLVFCYSRAEPDMVGSQMVLMRASNGGIWLRTYAYDNEFNTGWVGYSGIGSSSWIISSVAGSQGRFGLFVFQGDTGASTLFVFDLEGFNIAGYNIASALSSHGALVHYPNRLGVCGAHNKHGFVVLTRLAGQLRVVTFSTSGSVIASQTLNNGGDTQRFIQSIDDHSVYIWSKNSSGEVLSSGVWDGLTYTPRTLPTPSDDGVMIDEWNYARLGGEPEEPAVMMIYGPEGLRHSETTPITKKTYQQISVMRNTGRLYLMVTDSLYHLTYWIGVHGEHAPSGAVTEMRIVQRDDHVFLR